MENKIEKQDDREWEYNNHGVCIRFKDKNMEIFYDDEGNEKEVKKL